MTELVWLTRSGAAEHTVTARRRGWGQSQSRRGQQVGFAVPTRYWGSSVCPSAAQLGTSSRELWTSSKAPSWRSRCGAGAGDQMGNSRVGRARVKTRSGAGKVLCRAVNTSVHWAETGPKGSRALL